TAKSIEQALKDWQPEHHFHFASTHDLQDATFSGSIHLPWLGRLFRSDIMSSSANDSWMNTWKAEEERFRNHLQNKLSGTDILTDGHIYHRLVPQCSADDFIMISNSFPARDVQL